ncbi:MAG: hypothetical protein ISS26_05610 [Candidatus Omnitrophica bacterium]|nr:hypothetical protein [Candidatus Omnitrophota bacterium]
MRANIIQAAITLILIISCSRVYGDNVAHDKEVNIRFAVDSQFGMEFWEDELDQQLPHVVPGGNSSGNIHLFASSNHTLPWTVKASSAGLKGENNGSRDVIPVKMSTFISESDLKGIFVQNIELNEQPQTIYTSGEGESPCSDLPIGCSFFIETSNTTKEGVYSGSIVLTLTE